MYLCVKNKQVKPQLVKVSMSSYLSPAQITNSNDETLQQWSFLAAGKLTSINSGTYNENN